MGLNEYKIFIIFGSHLKKLPIITDRSSVLVLGTHKYSWLDVSGRSCGSRAKMYVDHDYDITVFAEIASGFTILTFSNLFVVCSVLIGTVYFLVVVINSK